MSGLQYWLWLTLKKGMTSRKITVLLERFGSPEAVFHAESGAFSNIPELRRADILALESRDLSRVMAVMETCKKKNIKILTFDSTYYPYLLSQIYDPPYVLYVRSKDRIDLNEHLTVAMVGTRKLTEYGRKLSVGIARALAQEGVTIVSGMAAGGDSAAHSGALKGGGITVAVLGCGVDRCYPAHNKRLMEEIINHGMVLSEFPPGTPPLRGNFPLRNRIISGLSYGLVVTEAPKQSGTLITARLAAEQSRDVFVVPGDITRAGSAGSNQLLYEGVKPILKTEDILEEYKERFGELLQKQKPVAGVTETGEQPPVPESPERHRRTWGPDVSEQERAVLSVLNHEPRHIDQLQDCGLSAAELSAVLTMLEMKGLIRALPGKQFCLE